MTTDLEKALTNGVATWNEIEYRCKEFWIFKDSTAPSAEYLCFVPTQKTMESLFETYKAAYKWGYEGLVSGKWSGFNIVQAVGEAAGQSVNYPHIHMIPRNFNDLVDD